MFKRISYTLAIQFTAFVFALLLINGAVFMAVDLSNAQRLSTFRLDRAAASIVEHIRLDQGDNVAVFIPPPLRGRVRIVGLDGHTLYEGGLFTDVPFDPKPGYFHMTVQSDEYDLLTTRIMQGDGPAGYIQVADIERFQVGDLPLRSFIYLMVSIGISAITFGVGLLFARRSLKPAQQMMERLEQFTQDASHELRTPLAALNSSLDLALKNGKYRDGLLSAKDDVKEVSSLVERLLELARLDKFVLEDNPLDLSSLLEQSVEKFTPLAAERGVKLKGNIEPDITVHGDGALIRQIIGNLVSNAIKFSKPEGGTVTITADKRMMKVADDGIGMAAEEKAHIFDRFYQAETSRAKDGYGLGLALVKRIADLHGWTIDVTSKKSAGTTFTVRFGKRG